jgi:hypothetical protein
MNEAGVPSVINGAYYQYTLLSLEAYNYHKRIFNQNTKDKFNITEDWPLFVWSNDRNSSFDSFEDCLASWEDKAAKDPSIDLQKVFKFEVPDARDRNKMESMEEYRHDAMNIELYSHIEDQFECSGMCKPALFYFGRPIS